MIANVMGIAAGGVTRVLSEDRVRLAVTGLSRAGKTVFITSLIHNLLALPYSDTLPRLSSRLTQNGRSRLRSVQVLPAGAGVLPFFDYEAKLRDLAAEIPAWPPRTEDLAQISLGLEIERPSAMGRWLGTKRIRLDILDYPGEWLLDLPMLDQSYAEWSAQTLALLRTAPRDVCCAPFFEFVSGLRPDDRAEESLLHKGHVLYREALHACRKEHGLRYLQPGRFICPGPYSDAPFMWFFPLDGVSEKPKPGTAASLLRERFDRYKDHIRASFFNTHFAAFDRQIMLVDVLGALCAGRAAFEDTAQALSEIARGLRYGGTGLMPRAMQRMAQGMGSHGIERITFVATKADHVPGLRRDNLRHLLGELADTSRDGKGNVKGQAGAKGVKTSHHVAASVLSTKDDVTTIQGRPMEVVSGTVLGDDKVRPFFGGDVPASGPPASYWRHAFFELPTFQPPAFDPQGRNGLPNLNLDAVIVDAIGDLL